MSSAIAFVPQPLLLLPGMTGGVVAEVEELRAACREAVDFLLSQQADSLVIVGSADGAGGVDDKPPLSIRVARSLLPAGLVTDIVLVDPAAPTEDCLKVGREIAARHAHVWLLAVGDGSACRTVKAPGYFDDRAAGFDDIVESALRDGEPGALARLDARQASELQVAGRAVWQVIAGVARSVGSSRILYADDPFGVWYPVACWADVSTTVSTPVSTPVSTHVPTLGG